ncbi:uncharacterized protein LOC128383656 [Scomber japonicus]|uniref:uncharacterized protein LOC128383656 n=1 Tax=Scomber japonicus TaxID=13676 RepID=UPI002305608A|nr:uncharacterized protein LOC128383656 [Scomber japonicus]
MRTSGFSFCCCFAPFFYNVAGGFLQSGSSVEVFAVLSHNASLPCRRATHRATSSRVLHVEWSRVDTHNHHRDELTVHVVRDGKELQKEKAAQYVGRTVVMENGSLTLVGVTWQDNGTYRCNLWRGRVKEEVLVSLIVGRPTGNRTLICRVEIPETILANENKIYIIDEFRPLNPGLSWCIPWVLTAFGLVGCGFLTFVVDLLKLKNLRSTLQSWYQASLSIRNRGEQEQVLPLVGNNSYTDYGDINRVDTTGASKDTIRANNLLNPGGDLSGVKASHMMAERDLDEMLKYKSIIKEVGEILHIHPALIAGIISRQSEAGTRLRKNGFGGSDENCFGLMQINRYYHAVKGEPCSKDHVDQGVTFLIQLIKTMVRTKPDWSPEQRLKGALACYIAGEDKVIPLERYEDLDSVTPFHDFANDVVARAQWFTGKDF